jgi:hypothetical protein
MKSFENWLTQEVKQTFGLKEVIQHPDLKNWLNANYPADADETSILKKLFELVKKKYKFWNEDELKFFFISDLVNLVNFNDSDDYTCFSQRILSAHVIDNQGVKVHLRGRAEWFIATGEQIPEKPFLFIHEYKPHLKTTQSDPLGQLLVTMVAAQSLNKTAEIIYGAYVMGKHWQFVILKDKIYSESKSFDCTEWQELLQIFSILKQNKVYIQERVS